MNKLWVVEMDYGATNWAPIAYCVSEKQAKNLASEPRLEKYGKPVRVREYGEPAPS